jgi:hypothetical protein
MARKKIREYDSKRLLKEHLKRLAGIDLTILSAQVSASASASASPPSRPPPLCLNIPPDSSGTGSAAACSVSRDLARGSAKIGFDERRAD